MDDNKYHTIDEWLNKVIYFDDGVRRDLILDTDRDRVFFFADPLDFDKDDQPVARYWIDECEDYDPTWHKMIVKHFVN